MFIITKSVVVGDLPETMIKGVAYDFPEATRILTQAEGEHVMNHGVTAESDGVVLEIHEVTE